MEQIECESTKCKTVFFLSLSQKVTEFTVFDAVIWSIRNWRLKIHILISYRNKTVVFVTSPAQPAAQIAARAAGGGGGDAALYPAQNDGKTAIVNNDYNDDRMFNAWAECSIHFFFWKLKFKWDFSKQTKLYSVNIKNNDTVTWVFPEWNGNLVNSTNSRNMNLKNHCSMNWAQFKDPVSDLFLTNVVVTSYERLQVQSLLMTNILLPTNAKFAGR